MTEVTREELKRLYERLGVDLGRQDGSELMRAYHEARVGIFNLLGALEKFGSK